MARRRTQALSTKKGPWPRVNCTSMRQQSAPEDAEQAQVLLTTSQLPHLILDLLPAYPAQVSVWARPQQASYGEVMTAPSRSQNQLSSRCYSCYHDAEKHLSIEALFPALLTHTSSPTQHP